MYIEPEPQPPQVSSPRRRFDIGTLALTRLATGGKISSYSSRATESGNTPTTTRYDNIYIYIMYMYIYIYTHTHTHSHTHTYIYIYMYKYIHISLFLLIASDGVWEHADDDEVSKNRKHIIFIYIRANPTNYYNTKTSFCCSRATASENTPTTTR